jgi:hypothetical protein
VGKLLTVLEFCPNSVPNFDLLDRSAEQNRAQAELRARLESLFLRRPEQKQVTHMGRRLSAEVFRLVLSRKRDGRKSDRDPRLLEIGEPSEKTDVSISEFGPSTSRIGLAIKNIDTPNSMPNSLMSEVSIRTKRSARQVRRSQSAMF